MAPALLARMSIRSYAASRSAASRRTSSSRVKSATCAWPPIRSATAAVFSADRPTTATVAPSSASRRAASAPIPELAPVITTVLPRNCHGSLTPVSLVSHPLPFGMRKEIFPNGRWRLSLAESECVGLGPGIEEIDLEGAVGYGAALADELIQALFGYRSGARAVDVEPMRRARRPSVDEHAEPDGRARYRGPHDQVQVAGVEAVRDPPAGLVQRGGLFLQRPVSGQGPVIEPQFRRDRVGVPLAWHGAAGGREVLGALIAGVVLR